MCTRKGVEEMKKLGFGTMRLPQFDADNPKSIDYEQFERMVDTYLDRGFTYFDTAYPYHGEMSEGAVKRCLVDRHPRSAYVLADKMPIVRVKSSSEYQTYFDEQKRRCGVDYFDYYLLHNMGKDRYANTCKYGGFDFVSRLKEKGDVGKIGFSFHDDAELLDKILTEHPEVDFVQLQINYLDWDSAVAQSGACYETACRHNKPVIVMEPVKGGTLANLPKEALDTMKNYGAADSPASYAVRFAAGLENVFMVLSGMSSYDQLLDNTSYMQEFTPLNEKEKKMLEEITAILNKTMEIACTSCKYCMEECPKNINIPAYFGLYNLHSVTGKKTNMYYERYTMGHGLASECIQCGKCENICPQKIKVREFLKKFAALYEENAD
jgi:hypothetical protein